MKRSEAELHDFIERQLSALEPSPSEAPASVPVANRKLQNRLGERKSAFMLERLFSRRFKPAWGVLTAVALLVLILAFPPVRALATDFLGLFRVERIAVVEVNPANVPAFDRQSSEIENILADSLQVEDFGESQDVESAAEASALAGISVRLPSAVNDGLQSLTYQPGSRMTFEVDLPTTRALLEQIGRSDVVLPEQLDDATVTIDIPNNVTAAYGDCVYDETEASPFNEGEARACTVLVQMPSPTISAPPNLPIDQLGEVWLQLMGLSEEEAAQFSSTVDWSTTLVVPIPSRGATAVDVVVDGVSGTLLSRQHSEWGEYMVLWIKDDVVYMLTGYGDSTAGLSIANSLE